MENKKKEQIKKMVEEKLKRFTNEQMEKMIYGKLKMQNSSSFPFVLEEIKYRSCDFLFEHFKKMTKMSIDDFLMKLEDNQIEIIENRNNDSIKCINCLTEYKLLVEKEELLAEILFDGNNGINKKNPFSKSNYTEFNCVNCNRKFLIHGKIKRIEVIYND